MVLSKDLLAIHGGGRKEGRDVAQARKKSRTVCGSSSTRLCRLEGRREKKMETTKESFDVELSASVFLLARCYSRCMRSKWNTKSSFLRNPTIFDRYSLEKSIFSFLLVLSKFLIAMVKCYYLFALY